MTKESKFLELIEEHNGILVKLTRIYADSPQDQDDLRQEIVARLWESFDRFENRSKFSSWMYRVGLNTSITLLKRKKRSVVETLPPENNSAIVSTDQATEAELELHFFYRAIKKLNEIEKAIIFLFLEGLSYREIAERMGISEGNARVKLSRTKDKIRKIAKGLGHGL